MEKVINGREKRHQPAKIWIHELKLPCSDTTFTRIIYEFRQYFLSGGQKPELNNGCMYLRNKHAQEFLKYNF